MTKKQQTDQTEWQDEWQQPQATKSAQHQANLQAGTEPDEQSLWSDESENGKRRPRRTSRFLSGFKWLCRQLFSAPHVIRGLAFLGILSSSVAASLIYKALKTLSPEDANKAFDYLSFVLPCYAAVAAGMAVINKKLPERPLFSASCLLLAMGFFFYLAAHRYGNPAIAAILAAILVYLFTRLIVEWKRCRWERKASRILALVGIVVLGLVSCVLLLQIVEVGST